MFLVKILVSSSYKKDLKLTTMIRIFEKVNKIYFEFAFKFYISLWSLSTFCSFVLFCDLWNTLFKFFFILFFKKFFFLMAKCCSLFISVHPSLWGIYVYICLSLMSFKSCLGSAHLGFFVLKSFSTCLFVSKSSYARGRLLLHYINTCL